MIGAAPDEEYGLLPGNKKTPLQLFLLPYRQKRIVESDDGTIRHTFGMEPLYLKKKFKFFGRKVPALMIGAGKGQSSFIPIASKEQLALGFRI